MVFGAKAEYMLSLAECESGKQQFKNGKPLVSPTDDWGYFQINRPTWDDEATALGLDYKNDPYHNILMAYYVSQKQGVGAWVCNDIVYGRSNTS